jgi:hypothetical protein
MFVPFAEIQDSTMSSTFLVPELLIAPMNAKHVIKALVHLQPPVTSLADFHQHTSFDLYL